MTPKTIHLIAACGTAMGSLAGILKQKGFAVTGSDQNVYPPMSTQLEAVGVKLMNGYKAEANLKAAAEIVPWLQKAIHKHYPTSTYNLNRLKAIPDKVVEFPASTDDTTS